MSCLSAPHLIWSVIFNSLVIVRSRSSTACIQMSAALNRARVVNPCIIHDRKISLVIVRSLLGLREILRERQSHTDLEIS